MTHKPDVDDLDSPELLDADVALMRPASEVLPRAVLGGKLGQAEHTPARIAPRQRRLSQP